MSAGPGPAPRADHTARPAPFRTRASSHRGGGHPSKNNSAAAVACTARCAQTSNWFSSVQASTRSRTASGTGMLRHSRCEGSSGRGPGYGEPREGPGAVRVDGLQGGCRPFQYGGSLRAPAMCHGREHRKGYAPFGLPRLGDHRHVVRSEHERTHRQGGPAGHAETNGLGRPAGRCAALRGDDEHGLAAVLLVQEREVVRPAAALGLVDPPLRLDDQPANSRGSGKATPSTCWRARVSSAGSSGRSGASSRAMS